jgi:ABC-type metal ion transport system substrate-binding protein
MVNCFKLYLGNKAILDLMKNGEQVFKTPDDVCFRPKPQEITEVEIVQKTSALEAY